MTHTSGPSSDADWTGLAQLTLTLEELSVAEDELRAQNEELERTRAAIDAERARYRELFHHAPIPYLVTDRNGTIREANRAAAKLLECRIDFLVGKPLTVFAAPNGSRRKLRALIDSTIHAEASVSASFTIVPRSGPHARVEATSAAMRGVDGAAAEIRWLIVDRTKSAKRARIRRRRAAEMERLVAERTAELAHAHKLKDQLLATVSHELRTVLSAIGGYAELLEMGMRGPLTEPQLVDIRRIQRAYDHLNKVVDDLLSYSKVVSGKLALEPMDFEIGALVHEVIDLVGPEARRKELSIEVPGVDGVPSSTRVHLRADIDRTRQILINLIGNAVKFTRPGGRVLVRWRAVDDMAVVEVADNGPGIPPGSEERIFQPFVRLQRESSEPGTGLGLSISRQYARLMDGDLGLCPQTGEGSCFALRLPLSMELASFRRDEAT